MRFQTFVFAILLELSMLRTLNAATLLLNASTEATRYTAYDDARPNYVLQPGDKIIGTLTIGRGHSGPDVSIGLLWTQAQVDAAQMRDLSTAEEVVLQACTDGNVTMTDNQLGATTDFVFNIGIGAFTRSTARKLIVAGNLDAVPAEFQRYIYSKGKKLPGLVTRRAKETLLYNSPDPITLPTAVEPSVTPDNVETPRVWSSKAVIGACVAGVSTVCSAAPEIGDTLTNVGNQLQPLVDYGHVLKVAFLACSLGGITLGGISSFMRHRKDAAT